MSRHRELGDPSIARVGPSSSSDAARHTTQLVQQLARSLFDERSGRRTTSADAPAASEAQIHGAVRLCVRILTSHIGEPLMVEDEASIAQTIRTRLAKVRHDFFFKFIHRCDPIFEFPSCTSRCMGATNQQPTTTNPFVCSCAAVSKVTSSTETVDCVFRHYSLIEVL